MRWRVTPRLVALGLAAVVTAIVLFSRDFEREHPAAPATSAPDNLQEQEPEHGTEEGEGDETRGIVQLLFMGRLGNNLFEYAAARSLADRLGWPLSLEAAPGKRLKFSTLLMGPGMRCFPGVRPVGLGASTVRMETLETVPFRGMQMELADPTPRTIRMQDWYQKYRLFSSDRDRLRQIMALNLECCGPNAPGPNDLVIHLRNYRAELTDEQYTKLHFKDLGYEFYAAVLRDVSDSAAGGPDIVWIVGEIEDHDPLIVRLKEDHENIKIAGLVEDQFRAFCFLMRAPRLVMAHSTFSWWTAFLGNATEVHFPLSKPHHGVTVPEIAVTGDPRYVYRDDTGLVVPPPAGR